MRVTIVGVLIVFLFLLYYVDCSDIFTLQKLTKEDRRRFFTYQIYLEYFRRHANDSIKVSEETTAKIYDYFSKKYQMGLIDDDLLKYVTCQWIEIDGECIDPDDPGIYPILLNENL